MDIFSSWAALFSPNLRLQTMNLLAIIRLPPIPALFPRRPKLSMFPWIQSKSSISMLPQKTRIGKLFFRRLKCRVRPWMKAGHPSPEVLPVNACFARLDHPPCCLLTLKLLLSQKAKGGSPFLPGPKSLPTRCWRSSSGWTVLTSKFQ